MEYKCDRCRKKMRCVIEYKVTEDRYQNLYRCKCGKMALVDTLGLAGTPEKPFVIYEH